MSGSTVSRRTRLVAAMAATVVSLMAFTSPAQAAQDFPFSTAPVYTAQSAQMAQLKATLADSDHFSVILPVVSHETEHFTVTHPAPVRIPPAAPVRVTISSTLALARAAMDIALKQLGKPYVYGATGPGAFDCSGLVYYAYHHAGFASIARTAQQQFNEAVKVSWNDAVAGDLVFFGYGTHDVYHVGIYLGIINGVRMMVAAPHTGTVVKREEIYTAGTDVYFGSI